MDNQGAFITMKGEDMIPNFTSYDAVVSIILWVLIQMILNSF